MNELFRCFLTILFLFLQLEFRLDESIFLQWFSNKYFYHMISRASFTTKLNIHCFYLNNMYIRTPAIRIQIIRK